MDILRYHECELPIHNADTDVVWSTRAISERAKSGIATFVRRVVLQYDGTGTLQDALDIADERIATAADLLKVQPVGYAWGLYQRPDGSDNELARECRHRLIPKGFSLVAEVDTITPAEPLSASQRSELESRLNAYYKTVRGNILCDLGARQFVSSMPKDQDQPTIWLVDIEPRIDL